jgi:hypothetical protein
VVWLLSVPPLTGREVILLAALPAGFFGILWGNRDACLTAINDKTIASGAKARRINSIIISRS